MTNSVKIGKENIHTALPTGAVRKRRGKSNEKTLFEILCTMVRVACALFAYGVAGSLELGRLEFAEALRLILGAGAVWGGTYVVTFLFASFFFLAKRKKSALLPTLSKAVGNLLLS